MKIGIVGYQGAGKSTLFTWLTGIPADPAVAHTTQHAMATVPDARVAQLCEIYHPKKITQAQLEFTDTPGLSRTHEGSAAKLAMIRETGCLVIVVSAFGGNDAAADVRNFADDLLIADLDIVTGRLERLREAVKKPRPDREALQKELEWLTPLQAGLEAGQLVGDMDLNPEQSKAIRSFQLFTEKPRFILINMGDDEPEPDRFQALAPPGVPLRSIALGMELELSRMDPAERAEFCQEMGLQPTDRDQLLQQLMQASGQMLFLTAGEKEVRTWMIRQGGTAVEAAGNIHTDLARGFIRAEVMKCADLVRLGSEREIKANNLLRQEPKDYVIQDGDILLIRHN